MGKIECQVKLTSILVKDLGELFGVTLLALRVLSAVGKEAVKGGFQVPVGLGQDLHGYN